MWNGEASNHDKQNHKPKALASVFVLAANSLTIGSCQEDDQNND